MAGRRAYDSEMEGVRPTNTPPQDEGPEFVEPQPHLRHDVTCLLELTSASSISAYANTSIYNRTLPYRYINISHSFGKLLSPVHFRRRLTRSVSYYALFKGLLLLSKPPDCLCTPTSFIT